jgi:hypothetical protein
VADRFLKLSSLLLILLCWACIDRITFETDTPTTFAVVIDGYISDEPGPYTINVSKAFDLESKLSIKTPINVKRMVISDNVGNTEELTKIVDGEYQTSPLGIQGVIGRAYTLEVELLDGRKYISKPDTMYSSGQVDDVYFQYKTEADANGATTYGFDVLFNSSAGNSENYYYMWKFVGTFQVETNPELFTEPCGESRCPKPLPCSAYSFVDGGLQEVRPCTCCTCWTSIFNNEPIISDNQLVNEGKFLGVKASYVPINQWTFMYKVHAEVRQMSLSPNAFAFWRGIQSQKRAYQSLFQPLSGKIPGNFIQISGSEGPIEGLFFATSIKKNSVFITRDDVPNQTIIPVVELPFSDSCLKLFPYSTSTKPSFWVD